VKVRSRPQGNELAIGIGTPIDIGVGSVQRGRRARAVGGALAPSGAGFNLVLMAQNEADLYGRWVAFYFRRNPLAAGLPEGPDEFPLPPQVATHELELLDAATAYDYREVPFSADLLVPLLEELI